MRPVAPAPPRRPRYPRLERAWRILIATPIAILPSLAQADATLPHDGNGRPGNENPAPPPKPPAPPPDEWPGMGGDVVSPDPPQPPPPPKAKEKPKKPEKSALLLHRHAPDEPCKPLARKV
jgi:hypothetical protein